MTTIIEFLNRPTQVFTGAERLATEFNCAVVTGRMRRVAKGRYEVEFELLVEHPQDSTPGVITEVSNRDVEALILEKPGGGADSAPPAAEREFNNHTIFM